MYKLEIYVPQEACNVVKKAICDAGAGRLGMYKDCAWLVMGQGQFTPLYGAQPSLGQINEPCFVTEIKLECLVSEDSLANVLEAMLQAHPYEEPAYAYWPVSRGLS